MQFIFLHRTEIPKKYLFNRNVASCEYSNNFIKEKPSSVVVDNIQPLIFNLCLKEL